MKIREKLALRVFKKNLGVYCFAEDCFWKAWETMVCEYNAHNMSHFDFDCANCEQIDLIVIGGNINKEKLEIIKDLVSQTQDPKWVIWFAYKSELYKSISDLNLRDYFSIDQVVKGPFSKELIYQTLNDFRGSIVNTIKPGISNE